MDDITTRRSPIEQLANLPAKRQVSELAVDGEPRKKQKQVDKMSADKSPHHPYVCKVNIAFEGSNISSA